MGHTNQVASCTDGELWWDVNVSSLTWILKLYLSPTTAQYTCHILSLCLSSRCPRRHDTGAGPRHLIGRFCQQQFPGADLPPRARDPSFSHGGRVADGDHQEHRHQSGGADRLPHRNLHRHRGNRGPERAQTQRGALLLRGPVTTSSGSWQVEETHPAHSETILGHVYIYFLSGLLHLDVAAILGFMFKAVWLLL